MRVSLLPARAGGRYTHIGQVEIPVAWIEEFEENISHFHFWSEDGECFNQIQVLDEVATTDGDASKQGRIILLRDRRPGQAIRDEMARRADNLPQILPPNRR